jgi:hypothetical protein
LKLKGEFARRPALVFARARISASKAELVNDDISFSPGGTLHETDHPLAERVLAEARAALWAGPFAVRGSSRQGAI